MNPANSETILLVSCSSSKYGSSDASLRLRNVSGDTPELVLSGWIENLQKAEMVSTAGELYKGQYWSKLREIQRLNLHQHLWVVSAGLGLRTEEQVVPAYDATFSRGHEDSIPNVENGSQWWYEGLGGSQAFRQQMQTIEHPKLIVVLSRPYLSAVQADLAWFAERYSPEQLLIISIENTRNAFSTLNAKWTLVDERVANLVGGGVATIGMATLHYVLQHPEPMSDLNLTELDLRIQMVRKQTQDTPVLRKKKRERTSEEHKRTWIREQLTTAEPSKIPSQTGLLKQYRGLGYACEAKAFKALVVEEKGALGIGS